MRVISGIYKGRVLLGYNIVGTRPTMDRIKESLFAILQDKLQNSIVLDLFSGSGNLAIEALSAGASYAYLVDNNKEAIKVIAKNIANLKINNCQLINADFKQALKSLTGTKIDLIFLDPPYNTSYIEESIKLIIKYNLLSAEGIIICESSTLDKIIYPPTLKCIKERKYKDKIVVFLQQI